MLPRDGKMHFSNLKHIAESPLKYALSCDMRGEDTTAYRIGRAFHALVLQGIEPTKYDGIRRGKEWDAFVVDCESHQIKREDILSVSEYEQVNAMWRAVNLNQEAVEILNRCDKREANIEWERDGVPCSGRVDAYGDGAILELKSCSDARPTKFLRDAHKFGYHAQMAWYQWSMIDNSKLSLPWLDSYIIAVESSPIYGDGSGHRCVVYKLDELRLDQGNDLINLWINTYKDHEAKGFWPDCIEQQPIVWDGEVILETEEDQ